MGFIIAAAVAAAVIAFCFLCYKKAPPTQAIVVTGFGLSRPKVVCGRGVFVLPIVQRADRLNMRLLKIDVKTPETGVKTKEGVSLWLDSVVTVQVYSENSTVSDEEVRNAGYDDIRTYINSRQQSAISNFLGMDEAHINEKINDVLQGNLREIVSEMTVDQILTNRKQMAVSVVENARPDLAKMGPWPQSKEAGDHTCHSADQRTIARQPILSCWPSILTAPVRKWYGNSQSWQAG